MTTGRTPTKEIEMPTYRGNAIAIPAFTASDANHNSHIEQTPELQSLRCCGAPLRRTAWGWAGMSGIGGTP